MRIEKSYPYSPYYRKSYPYSLYHFEKGWNAAQSFIKNYMNHLVYCLYVHICIHTCTITMLAEYFKYRYVRYLQYYASMLEMNVYY